MISRITEAQSGELSAMFKRAIEKLPQCMAESWLNNPHGFQANVREIVFAQASADQGGEVYEKKRLGKVRRHLKGQLCHQCHRPMSGLLKFFPDETGWRLRGFSMPQKILVICGFCGHEMDSRYFDYRESKRNFSKAFRDLRRAWKKCATLLDALKGDQSAPSWVEPLMQAIERIRSDFLDADVVVYAPGTTGAELDDINCNQVLVLLQKIECEYDGEFAVLARFRQAYVRWMK